MLSGTIQVHTMSAENNGEDISDNDGAWKIMESNEETPGWERRV